MWQAATNIVLIFGQLAMLAAAPVYVCTSADGTQRLEWGDCGCDDGKLHVAMPRADRRASAFPLDELHLAESPCHCDHQPLTDDLRLVSRAEPDTRGALVAGLACSDGADVCRKTGSDPRCADFGPRGHTALSDRLSICLRC